MRYIIVSKKGDAVLSRAGTLPGHAPPPVFWLNAVTSEETNHKFAVEYPSADACHKGAEVHGGDARELPDEVIA